MTLLDSSAKLKDLLDKWKEVNQSQTSPVEILDEMSTILETEAAALNLLDPDPFDERETVQEEHVLGHLHKILTDNDFNFKVTQTYLFNSRNDFELNCASARLLINMMIPLRYESVFEDQDISVPKFLQWAKEGKEPLCTYACALLVYAMKSPGIVMDKVAELVPILIKKLHYLSKLPDLNAPCIEQFDFTEIEKSLENAKRNTIKAEPIPKDQTGSSSKTPSRKRKYNSTPKLSKQFQYEKPIMHLKPLTVGKQQDLIMRYLHPVSEYQELLPLAFELNVMELLFYYIDHHQQTDPQLACSALMYLSSLLCHKKFIVEFINNNGIQKILDIPQPSPVATLSSLCLYYMVYNEGNEDCVERVCLLPQATLQRLVEYLLWLLECSHISGRCHSALFFSLTFSFKSILLLFDSMDGLRKVVNLISTLKIMGNVEPEEDVYLDYEVAKNACQTLKKYFEVHMTMIGREHKNQGSKYGNSMVPKYKPMVITPDTLEESLSCIIEHSGHGSNNLHERLIIKRIISLEIPQLLLQLISLAANRKDYSNRFELFVTAFDTLLAMSAFKEIALAFCQQVTVTAEEKEPGIRILLSAIEGKISSDIQVRKAALKVICNCVTSSKSLLNEKADKNKSHRSLLSSQNKTADTKLNLIQKIWSAFRTNNAIMILLELLKIKSPITEADSVRALVCKALYGLAENELICQILGKLPIFHNEQLQILMRQPILSDRINEHLRFCNYASLLLERVTGKLSKSEFNTSKADIISQTRITYSQKELLVVIHNHLKKQGLENAAKALNQEANLALDEPSNRDLTPGTPYLTRDIEKFPYGGSPTAASTRSKRETLGFTPLSNKRLSMAVAAAAACGSSSGSPLTSPQTERRLLFTPKRRLSSTISSPSILTPSATSSQQSPLIVPPSARDRTQMEDKLKSLQRHRSSTPPPPTLDNIVTGYLREQHAKCTNPVATCPPFSLFRPHNCPKPKYLRNASVNITKRLFDRQRNPPVGGRFGRKHNRQFMYSKFRSGVVYKNPEEDEYAYSTCAWVSNTGSLALGCSSGDVKIINCMGQDDLFHHAHEYAVTSLEVSKDGKLMATSADFAESSGAVWRLVKTTEAEQPLTLQLKFELNEDLYIKFSNSQDRVIGTKIYTANVYDIGTGQLVNTYYDENNANNYKKNVACFSPCDDLILNDGCLWDVRANKLIHKFDKFNDVISGVFHPSGREIIINAEIWDVRTFRLLNTYPALENHQVTFSSLGDVIYATQYNKKDMNNKMLDRKIFGPFESSFRTFDAFDYSAIGTFDVKKSILSMSPDPYDQCLAVIEVDAGDVIHGYGEYDASCRLYDIGRTKRYGEEESDEEQEEEADNSPSSRGSNWSVDLDDFLDLLGNDIDMDGDYDDEGDGDDDDDNDNDEENDDGDSDDGDGGVVIEYMDDDTDDEY